MIFQILVSITCSVLLFGVMIGYVCYKENRPIERSEL